MDKPSINMVCGNCKWDKLNSQGQRMIQCGQGHARTFQKTIENCHAWKEKPKEKCWCEFDPDVRHGRLWIGIDINYTFPSWKFCPICGRKLNA